MAGLLKRIPTGTAYNSDAFLSSTAAEYTGTGGEKDFSTELLATAWANAQKENNPGDLAIITSTGLLGRMINTLSELESGGSLFNMTQGRLKYITTPVESSRVFADDLGSGNSGGEFLLFNPRKLVIAIFYDGMTNIVIDKVSKVNQNVIRTTMNLHVGYAPVGGYYVFRNYA